MKGTVSAAVLAIWSAVAVQAWPGSLLGGDLGGYGGSSLGSFGGGHGGSGGGGSGGGNIQLMGVPDIDAYGGLSFPSQGLQDLGTVYEGQIPSQTVKVTNAIALKIPQPYPVKIPHGVPVPYPVSKPYPVSVPQFIKVPHPVPIEVIKKVPVPIEVPKPYPVSEHEYKTSQGSDSYSGGFGGHQQLSQSYEIPSTSYGEPIHGGSGGYDSYASQSESSGYDSEHEGQPDQSASYPAVTSSQDQESEIQESSKE